MREEDYSDTLSLRCTALYTRIDKKKGKKGNGDIFEDDSKKKVVATARMETITRRASTYLWSPDNEYIAHILILSFNIEGY